MKADRTEGRRFEDATLLLLALPAFAVGIIIAVVQEVKRGGRDIRQLVRQANL